MLEARTSRLDDVMMRAVMTDGGFYSAVDDPNRTRDLWRFHSTLATSSLFLAMHAPGALVEDKERLVGGEV